MKLTKNKVFGTIFFGAVLLIATCLGNVYAAQHKGMMIPLEPQQIQASAEQAQPDQEQLSLLVTRSVSNTENCK